MKKTVFGFLLFIPLLWSCTKEKLDYNGMKINAFTGSYVTANDCQTTFGDTGTQFTFEIAYENPGNETVSFIDYDVIYPDLDGYFSYTQSVFTNTGAAITFTQCRYFTQDPYVDIRVFLVNPDGVRSEPKTFRVYKPV